MPRIDYRGTRRAVWLRWGTETFSLREREREGGTEGGREGRRDEGRGGKRESEKRGAFTTCHLTRKQQHTHACTYSHTHEHAHVNADAHAHV